MSGDTPPKATRLRPISTSYAGVMFRSRLEADWAYNLDHLRIAWSYEPEGIELPSGHRYLPDFWLPEIRTFLEVKGPGIPGLNKTREFAQHLADPTDGIEMGGAVVIGLAPIGNKMTFRIRCRYCEDWFDSDDGNRARWTSPYGPSHSRAAVESCRGCSKQSFVTYDPEGCGMDSRCWACCEKTAGWDRGTEFKRLPRITKAAS